jgi:hypothetical protein
VERPAPGAAPTAFRIWAAGTNDSDEGPVYFTRRSAKLLLAEQAARDRLYPSDFDHLSLLANRPPSAGRASGWHTLEIRTDENGEPELWAVGIDWCPDAREGLEVDPPQWRYFSPAFDTDEHGEIVSYVNFALCINPKSHGLPALAAHAFEAPKTKRAPVAPAPKEKTMPRRFAADPNDPTAVAKALADCARACNCVNELLAELGGDAPAPSKPGDMTADEKQAMRRAMGITTTPRRSPFESFPGGGFATHTMKPSDLRAMQRTGRS